jgi:ribosome maturation factor RimP
LRKAADFARFAGQRAELRMRTPDAGGRRKFVGVLRSADAGQVIVEVAGAGKDKEQVALALDDIDRAKLVPEL